jgi:predicted phosphoribosyltransferase
LFRDRKEAGRLLADALSFLKTQKEDVVVLAIPRGGVVVADEIARALGTPLDVVVTRKVGAPGNPELAIGAVTEDGEVIMDAELLRMLGVSDEFVKEEAATQVDEIGRRMKTYRGNRPYPSLAGKTVVVVDDGVATGSTIRAAIRSVRKRMAAVVILAVPVGPPDTIANLSMVADRVVCLRTPEPFLAIGEFYKDFEQVEDDSVREILRTAKVVG